MANIRSYLSYLRGIDKDSCVRNASGRQELSQEKETGEWGSSVFSFLLEAELSLVMFSAGRTRDRNELSFLVIQPALPYTNRLFFMLQMRRQRSREEPSMILVISGSTYIRKNVRYRDASKFIKN